MPTPGQSLDKYPKRFGKYHLLGPLAQGGMGALYLAVNGDRGLERLMVIKTVLPHLADAEYVARFRDEAKVVVKLSHGNLIPVFDAGQVGGELFLAMDFVEGRDLRAVWNRCAKKQVAFPVDIAVFIIKELCRGLAYAHSFPDLELVHRDISPPNILISYTGEVKLTDFGLASSTLKLEKTAPGIIYGKVAYMSPEQARGERLDGRSDLYAAAIVLWELLTGRQLFPPGKEQPQDLLTRARNPEVLRPSKRAPRVPAELDDIVVRGLAADRDERYQTCEELRQALQSWLATNAPTTDSSRMAEFVQDLFSDDIAADRAARDAMMHDVRKRAMTLPPSDELRQLLERSEGFQVLEPGISGPRSQVRNAGSVGRRAADRGDNGPDRRQANDRRGLAAEAVALKADPEDSQAIVGQVVDGRYRVAALVGEGGMGKVYLAEHVDIGKRVALKVLHPSYSRMPDLVERFRREARAASKIGHPHIVDVTDSGTTSDGSAYFVMEFLEGVELGGVIEREGALDVARGVRIAIQICQALSAAHAAGIIHRDLKPENIFLTIRGGNADFVKVLDFGIAKTTEAEEARERKLTSPGMAMGTPEYMAPEQAAGRPADARCDVYALGAILYEMLTGVPPYHGDNFMEILTKKATIDPAPAGHLRSTIPPAVSALVAQAMARNPDDRPPSMEAFEYELTKCVAGRGTAVAQIVGMHTDPHLFAALNPGISVRVIDSGPTRAVASPGTGVAANLRPITEISPPSTPPSATGVERMVSTIELSDLGQVDRSLEFPTQRSAAATFGWGMFVAAVLIGLGVVLYVAAGERKPPNELAAPVVSAPAALVVDAGARPVESHERAAAERPHAEPGSARGSSNGPRSVATVDLSRKDPVKSGAPARLETAPAKVSVQRGADGPKGEREAAELLKQADRHYNELNWAQAISKYNQVIASNQYLGQAHLGLARATWQTKNLDGAIKAAEKALRTGAGDDARKFLGHLYFRKGSYAQARTYYEVVLKHDPNDAEARGALDALQKAVEQQPSSR